MYLVGYIVVGPNWYVKRGNIIAGASTVFFFGSGTVSGHFAFNNLRIQNLATASSRVVLGVITVNGLLDIIGNNLTDIYQDTIEAKGDILVSGSVTGNTFCGGDAHIIINGPSNQLFASQAPSIWGFLPYIVIDKPPGGILTLEGTITTERSWTYIRGDVDAITEDSYVTFVKQQNIACPNPPGPYFIDGEESGNYMLFNKIEFQRSRILQGDVHIKERLIINDPDIVPKDIIITLNGYDLYIENPSSTFIQMTTNGYIISETSSPPSSIHWFIDNAGAGATYTFPFAAATNTPNCGYTPVFFDLTVQATGVPSGGTGWVSVATYPTDPNPFLTTALYHRESPISTIS